MKMANMPPNGTAANIFCRVKACSSGLMWQRAGAPIRGQLDICPSVPMLIPIPAIPRDPTTRKAIRLTSKKDFAKFIVSPIVPQPGLPLPRGIASA